MFASNKVILKILSPSPTSSIICCHFIFANEMQEGGEGGEKAFESLPADG